jgi:hypothetical protein
VPTLATGATDVRSSCSIDLSKVNNITEAKKQLKVLESVSFFLGGKKCKKIVNIGVMRKDRAAQQRLFSGTILRGLTQPLNAYGYKYFYLLLLLFYPFAL